MDIVLTIVLPVFGLIGLGFLAALTGYLKETTADGLVDFVFRVAIPLLIFRTVATADFTGANPWNLWASYFFGVLFTWAAGTLIIRRVFGRDARAGVVAGVSSAFANTVLIGIPLALKAYGDTGAAAVFLLISIHLPVMMLASAVLQERALRIDGLTISGTSLTDTLRSVAGSLIKNPLVVGILLGGAWYLSGWELSGLPAILIESLAGVAGTLALFAMGLSLRKYGVSGHVLPAFALALMKLSLMPALVLVAALYLFPLPPLWVKVMVLTAACPTGVNAFLIAGYFKTGQALASNTITLSTTLGLGSVSLWLIIVEGLL